MTERPTRPIEPTIKEHAEEVRSQVALLRASLKAKYGDDITDQEALEYLNYCHHLWMMRVMFAASGQEETFSNLNYILKDVGIDASRRLQARFTGSYPPPDAREEHFDSPEALEQYLQSKACNDPNCKNCAAVKSPQQFEPTPSAKLGDGSFRHNGYL